MAKAWLLTSFFLAATLVCHCNADDRKAHVVYMGDLLKHSGSAVSTHHSMLTDVLGSHSLAKESLIYSFGKRFNGFVAKLTDKEVAKVKDMEGVVSVFPNREVQLHTTRSWDFMGFGESHPVYNTEGDVIVGMIDTGIWPENPGFSDEGFGPPPAKWKGICQGINFTCNNKIIGARFYDISNSSNHIKSPRDTLGHGTHTASTAAGVKVKNASYYGLASGVARGGVPSARIAVYKVCWSGNCSAADILAAFDDAIADGVDIISVSLGNDSPTPYHEDSVSIGAFHAMKYGILTSCSAGNNGPFRREISNYAPWALTVAASTIDRSFVTKVVLGNGQTFTGASLNPFKLSTSGFPLVDSRDSANYTFGVGPELATLCYPGTLDTLKTKGGIVVCDVVMDGSVAIFAEAVGVIMPHDFDEVVSAFPVPVAVISFEDHHKLLNYIKTTEKPTATIFTTQTQKNVIAPTVASFSSRGPSPITPEILKPDITAPGVNILAAWSPHGAASVWFFDRRKVDYYVISGTSMSCPHASGVAAYLKAAHPTWSPAAIKSAIMTTANIMDSRKNEDAEFSYGSGHINPLKAIDPGLVYDATEADYVNFLCKEGYNPTHLRIISGDNSTCANNQTGKPWDLNYPSFALALLDGEKVMATYPRTVTNVGTANSTYHANVSLQPSFSVIVDPPVLTFSEAGEKKSFTLKITGEPIVNERIISGSLEWSDGRHVVHSPIVVFSNMPSLLASKDDQPESQKKYPGSWEGLTIYHNNGNFQGMYPRGGQRARRN